MRLAIEGSMAAVPETLMPGRVLQVGAPGTTMARRVAFVLGNAALSRASRRKRLSNYLITASRKRIHTPNIYCRHLHDFVAPEIFQATTFNGQFVCEREDL